MILLQCQDVRHRLVGATAPDILAPLVLLLERIPHPPATVLRLQCGTVSIAFIVGRFSTHRHTTPNNNTDKCFHVHVAPCSNASKKYNHLRNVGIHSSIVNTH